MEDAKSIDLILNYLYEHGQANYNYLSKLCTPPIPTKIFSLLIQKGLAKPSNISETAGIYIITDKGRTVVDSGGWTEFLEMEKQEIENNRIESDEVRRERALNIYKLIKDNKYFWVPYVLSFSALTVSALGYWQQHCNNMQQRNLIGNTKAELTTKYDLLRFQLADSTNVKNYTFICP